jgi:hypothetical protein
MELTGKALTFVIVAVRQRMEWYDTQLARTELSDDERSNLDKDKLFLGSLLAEMTDREHAEVRTPIVRRTTEPGHG